MELSRAGFLLYVDRKPAKMAPTALTNSTAQRTEEMTADGTADGTGELCLTLEPTLSPEDFEKHWLRLEMGHSEGLARPASPPERVFT
ncbi:hypothetical protein AAFF_G00369790 [Aldrovandia affinis]|uniref:Uncharacterized protein n=1 Tax=Aldrovandia affinis TaxID=143900 RepID=A0AAD7VYI9_9TELE|nr:hypothetical protein AAFF_G00369790 [Aldrovandia affinis]